MRARSISMGERREVLARLAAAPRRNLMLIELISQLGAPPNPSEAATHALGAWEAPGRRSTSRLAGVIALRPSLVLDSETEATALEAFVPHVAAFEAGLVKSAESLVTPLWTELEARGRSAIVDRIEQAFAVEPAQARLFEPPPGLRVRRAEEPDLEALVFAARASLKEERRPDPFDGDPTGFRRWVRGRIPRARVVEENGRVIFVGYADVRRSEGWLIQGVFTWPEHRSRGIARIGMSQLVREAFTAGADHVQLAVVEGNEPALRLYRTLGFTSFDKLRTVLFL